MELEQIPQAAQNSVTIIQGYQKSFYVDLFYADTGEPFDLTGATEIAVAFPTISTAAQPVIKNLSTNGVAIQGAPGAGKIKITVPAADSANLQVNPSPPQLQDLQIAVTNPDGKTAFLLEAVLNVMAPTYGVV